MKRFRKVLLIAGAGVLFGLLVPGQLYANGTASGTEVVNGHDSAVLNIADTFGDIVLSYISLTTGVADTITVNTSASTTVLSVYGDTISQPADNFGSRGSSIDYFLKITNRGNTPDSFQVVTSWIKGPDSWTVQLLGVDSAPLTDSSTGVIPEDAETTVIIRITTSDTAANGETTELQYIVRAHGGLGGDTNGYTGFNGVLYAGVGDDSGTVITTVFAADIHLAKRIESATVPIGYDGNPGDVVPGAYITYKITYDNDGNDSAVGMQIVDYIPRNTIFDTAENIGNSPDSKNLVMIIEYDTGDGVFRPGNPGTAAIRIRWSVSNPVPPEQYGTNADLTGTAQESSAPDFDAGIIRFRVIVK